MLPRPCAPCAAAVRIRCPLLNLAAGDDTISHRVFRKSHRNFETPGNTLPDTVFRRGKKILGTPELDTIRLRFCFVRWIALTAVKEAGYEGSMVRSILMAIKHVRHPLRPCPRPCLPSGLMKVPPFDRGHSELPSHLFPKGKHKVWGQLPGSFERPGEI